MCKKASIRRKIGHFVHGSCVFSCSTLLPKPVDGSPEGPLDIFYDQFTRILLKSIDSV